MSAILIGTAAVGGIAALTTFFNSVVLTDQEHQNVVTEWGKFKKTLGPGWGWKIPFIQKAFQISTENVQIPAQISPKVSTLTLDKLPVELDPAVHYQVIDGGKAAFITGGNMQQLQTQIAEIVAGELNVHAQSYSLEDLRTKSREIGREIVAAINPGIEEKFGVRINQVIMNKIILTAKTESALEDVRTSELELRAAENRARTTKVEMEGHAHAVAAARKILTESYSEQIEQAAAKLGKSPLEVEKSILTMMGMDVITKLGEGSANTIIVTDSHGSVFQPGETAVLAAIKDLIARLDRPAGSSKDPQHQPEM